MASKDEAKKERKLKSKEEEEEDDDDDEEDEDFVPGEASEDEEEEDVVDEDDELELKHKKRKLDKDESEVELSEEQLKAKEEQEKKKAEDIWSSFLKDVNQIAKKPSASSLSSTSNAQKSPLGHNFNTQTDKHSSESNKSTSKSDPLKDVFKSAEKSSNEKKSTSVPTELASNVTASKSEQEYKKAKPPGGLASVLSKIGKQSKQSTLEKSRLDWLEFKKAENLEDELSQQTKSKHSYLDKQDFLYRADMRQFEIEKELRDKERRLRENK